MKLNVNPGTNLALVIARLAEANLAFAEASRLYQPSEDDIKSPILYWAMVDADPNHPAIKGGESELECWKIPLRRIANNKIDLWRQAILEYNDDIWFREPYADYRRTPCQPFEGVIDSYLEKRWGYKGKDTIIRRLIRRGEDPEWDEVIDLKEACQSCAHHGWMQRLLMSAEIKINGRWRYWHECRAAETLINAPIPQIQWQTSPHSTAIKHLEFCLDQIHPQWIESSKLRWRCIEYFFEWLLWSLGDPFYTGFPKDPFDGRVHDRLVQVFYPHPLLAAPYDYLGMMLVDLSDEHCYIPDQMTMQQAVSLAEKMFPQSFKDKAKHGFGYFDHRSEMFFDIETGSGRFLMAASNYCMGGRGINSGFETNNLGAKLLSQAAKINAWLFMPELVMPHPTVGFNQTEKGVRDCESRTFAIAKARGIDPVAFFAQHELIPKWEKHLPILQMRRAGRKLNTKEAAPKLRLGYGVKLNIGESKPAPVETPKLNVGSKPKLPPAEPVKLRIGEAKPETAQLPEAKS